MDTRIYDIIAVSSSGGIDSLGALDTAYCTCDRLVVIHADLGRMEWKGTKDIARQQAEWYGVPFYVCRREKDGQPQDLLEHVVAKHNANLVSDKKVHNSKTGEYLGTVSELTEAGQRPPWFGMRFTQYCTSEHKRGPICKVYTQLKNEWKEHSGLTRPCRLLEVCGMRADESGERAKMKPFTSEVKGKHRPTTLWVDQWLPIHHWTKDQAWERAELNGTPTHPAYHLNGWRKGMPRLSCVFCIYPASSCKGRNAIVLAAKHNPDLLDDYCAVEAYTGYTFTQTTSLTEIRDQLHTIEAPGEVFI